MAEVKIEIAGDASSAEKAIKSTQDKMTGLTGAIKEQQSPIVALKGAFAALGVTMAAMAAFSYAKEATMMAARYETLGVTMQVVGNNAGYTGEQMAGFQAKLQATGIAMTEARSTLISLAQAHVDLSKASALARVAQDAAVIGGLNSSEAFERITYGIQSAQVEVLRTIGINVNFEDSYKKLAMQLGKTAEELTETEKVTARVNAVLEKGKDITGAYEAAMGTAGKQIQSMKRYMDDLKVKAGEVFQDALTVAVEWATGSLKGLNKEADDLAKKNQLDKWGRESLMAIAFVADAVQGLALIVSISFDAMSQGFKNIIHGWSAVGKAIKGDISGAWGEITAVATESIALVKKEFAKVGNITSFQDTAKQFLANKEAAKANVAALDEVQKKRMAAGEASKKEREEREKGIMAEKRYVDDMKNNIGAVKEYASAMRDLGKERLAVAEDKFKNKMKEEFELFEKGMTTIQDTVAPLRKYSSEVTAVYNERISNEKNALNTLSGIYAEFSKKMKLTASVKDVQQHGVDLLKEVKGQATQIIKVETDRYKTLLKGEQEYANKVMELITTKKKEIEDLKIRFEEANKTFEEKKRTALGDFSGDFKYLDPNLDALARYQVMIEKLARDEAEYERITDPKRKQEKLLGLIATWETLDQQIDLGGQTVITREQAIAKVEEERTRLQEKIIANAVQEQDALEASHKKAMANIEAYTAKVLQLDELLKSLTRDITINLRVNGMEQLNAIQNIVGAAVAPVDDEFIDEPPSNAIGTSYIGKTGLRQVHAGEVILNRQEVSRAGNYPTGSTINGGITINVTGGNTATETVKEIARKLKPELDRLNSRYRKAA